MATLRFLEMICIQNRLELLEVVIIELFNLKAFGDPGYKDQLLRSTAQGKGLIIIKRTNNR